MSRTNPSSATRRLTTTTKWVALLILFAACGSDAEPNQFAGQDGKFTGPIQEGCARLVDEMCCAHDPDAPIDERTFSNAYLDCARSMYGAACQLLGGSPTVGCHTGGACIRSSVDFESCFAAVEAIGGCAERTTLPAECVSGKCTTENSCPEDPGIPD